MNCPWMKFLAGIMGVVLLGYAAKSNQFHASLRNRPDAVSPRLDDNVARTCWMLCLARKNTDG
jgi:hypothetical protein